MIILYKYFAAILKLFGLQNVIMIEMERVQRENTEAVFWEMLRRGWNKRFRIVLVSVDPEQIRCWKTLGVTIVKRVYYDDSWTSKMRMRWLRLRAYMIIDENRQIRKRNPKTIHIFLYHGSPVKSIHAYYNCTDETDFSLCQSEFWRPIESFQLIIPEEKLVIKGFPRNDALFSSRISMEELFGKKYNKVVVWYPTFRQHRNKSGVSRTDSSPLPIIHDESAANIVNEIAARYGILIVVKPHPAQDLSVIKALDLDCIKLINDDFFVSHGITSYAFLGKTDALITDYSSVIFDYLLTGKPIALTWEDFEEYKERVGFTIDMNLLRSCASLLNSPRDFDVFFRDLVEGNDPLRERREELMHLTNQYTDGNSTKRVVDWLETLLKP